MASCELGSLKGTQISIATVAQGDCGTNKAFADYGSIADADWKKIGAVTEFKLDGEEYSIAETEFLEGGNGKSKEELKLGKADITILYKDQDDGQSKLKEAYASNDTYALRFVYPNGKIAYTEGLVSKLSLPSGGKKDLYKREVTVDLTQPIVSDF